MGNIGEPVRKVDIEPLPQTEPVTEPAAPAVTPAEPEKVPA